jgi:hypothetical protein
MASEQYAELFTEDPEAKPQMICVGHRTRYQTISDIPVEFSSEKNNAPLSLQLYYCCQRCFMYKEHVQEAHGSFLASNLCHCLRAIEGVFKRGTPGPPQKWNSLLQLTHDLSQSAGCWGSP